LTVPGVLRAVEAGRYSGATIVTMVGGLGYLFVTLWAIGHLSYDIWGALLLAPLLAAVTMPVITRAARLAGDDRMARLLVWALAYKGLMTVARFFVIEVVYGGVADASGYYSVGGRLAESYRHFEWVLPEGRILGSGFLEVLTGIVFTITGQTRLGGFVVFSWFSFIGFFLLYRAFVIAVPNGDHRRYALLLLFTPSVAFWPSSIGKEAWSIFCIGIAAYGAAVLLRGRPVGLIGFAVGLGGTAMIRPHITLMLFVGLLAAFLVRRPQRRTQASPVIKAAGLLVLLAGGVLVANTLQTFFRVDSVDTASVQEVLANTQDRSTQGGSSYDPVDLSDPSAIVTAPVTVLFRPFPTEAHNTEAIIAAAEAMFVLLVTFFGRRRLYSLPRMAGLAPYVVFVAVFTLMFVYAFSSVGNFGILARQRVQVLPFLFAALSVPIVLRRRATPVGDEQSGPGVTLSGGVPA
jgi:hypothetical protein